MLRDTLTRLSGVGTWPCDEINLIWRHGNRHHDSDELTPEMARPEVRHYLHRKFAAIGERYRVDTVVEKTCANSLRVPFVARAFPHAKFIVIYRNGIDATASAAQRRNAPFQLAYTARKARYAPWQDVAHYARRAVWHRLTASRSHAPRNVPSWWGPKTDDFDELRWKHPVEELCAIQWQRCVDATLRAFEEQRVGDVLYVEYERFVSNPDDELRRILAYLDIEERYTPDAVACVSREMIGKGRAALAPATVQRLESLIDPTLKRLDYA